VVAILVGVLVAEIRQEPSAHGRDPDSAAALPDSTGQLSPDAGTDSARVTLKTETCGPYTVRLQRGSGGSGVNHIEVVRDGHIVYSRDILMGSFMIGHVSDASGGGQLVALGPPLTKDAVPALVIAERTDGETGPVSLRFFEFGGTLRHVTTLEYGAELLDPAAIAGRQDRSGENESGGGPPRPDQGARRSGT
jgi:hypothetical protein